MNAERPPLPHQPIQQERLEVLPFASLCVKCQRKKELNQDFEEQVPEAEA